MYGIFWSQNKDIYKKSRKMEGGRIKMIFNFTLFLHESITM